MLSGDMLYATRAPPPPLSPFVEYLWSLQDAPSHAMERIVPSGTLELVVNVQEDELRIYSPDGSSYHRHAGACVSGAYPRFFVIDTREHASLVGVHFRVGKARSVLGVPPGEIADRHVDLATLWSRAASE